MGRYAITILWYVVGDYFLLQIRRALRNSTDRGEKATYFLNYKHQLLKLLLQLLLI